MLVLGLFSLWKNNGFALFKLAMYVQPVLIPLLVALLFKFNRIIAITCIGFLFATNIYFLNDYINFSRGYLSSPFVEIPLGSNTQLIQNLEIINSNINNSKIIISDSHNVVLAKLISLSFPNKKLEFYANQYFTFAIKDNSKSYSKDSLTYHLLKIQHNKFGFALKNIQEWNSKLHENHFVTHDINYKSNSFKTYDSESNPSDVVFLISSPLRTVLNRSKFPEVNNSNFVTIPFEQAKNFLMFIYSDLGVDYYYNLPISIYNLEQDYFFHGKSLAKIGRYFLFRAINPDPKVRVELNITSSLINDANHKLLKAKIIGTNSLYLPIMGRGSAHIFSTIINPQIISQIPYLMLDLDAEHTISKPIFNQITCHARNISLISDKDYLQLTPPTYLNNFPKSLANSNLEYSGIYEDGWLSEDSFFKLTQPNQHSKLVIKGTFPKIKDVTKTQLKILIDDVELSRQTILPGEFNLQYKLPSGKKIRKVELHFSQEQILPNDNRIIAAKLNYIGFVTNVSLKPKKLSETVY